MKVETLRREKISEKDERILKVNQLKDKIRAELNDIRNAEMRILNTFNMNREAYKECILTLATLFAIEDFIDNPNTFMEEDSVYTEQDVVIYVTHSYYINLMLDDSFIFCQRILTRLSSQKDRYYSLGAILSERYLIPNIISIFDELEYDDKRGVKND